jgi:hypothetical protein
MKKILVLLVLAALTAAPAFSEVGLKMFMKGEAAADTAFIDWFIVPAVGFAYQPGLLGAGVELKAYYGPRSDGYFVALGELRIWWFYLGAGISFAEFYPSGPYVAPEGVNLAATLGLDLPVIKLGPGSLIVNVGLDTVFTALPAGVVSTFLSSGKVTLGLGYRFEM